MRQQKIIFLLLVVTVALIILLSTGIGYAAIVEDALKIDDTVHIGPEHSDFNIKFEGKPTCTGDGKAVIKITGGTTANLNVSGLSSAGDYVLVTFNIRNTSHDLVADLSKSVSNSNTEYFKVIAELSNNTIASRNGVEKLTVRIELIKTPIYNEEIANLCVKVIASPNYNY